MLGLKLNHDTKWDTKVMTAQTWCHYSASTYQTRITNINTYACNLNMYSRINLVFVETRDLTNIDIAQMMIWHLTFAENIIKPKSNIGRIRDANELVCMYLHTLHWLLLKLWKFWININHRVEFKYSRTHCPIPNWYETLYHCPFDTIKHARWGGKSCL